MLHLQLEEFEKAVRLSHENYPSEAQTITRHEHFMGAIGNQISHIEKAVRDEGKQPLRWIQLNAEEQDDFALFLSEVPLNLQDSSQGNSWSECAKGSKDTVVASNGSRHAMEVAMREPHKSVEQLRGLGRTSSSVDESSWKIEVSDDIEADSRQSVEPIPEMRINPSILSRLWKSVESSRLRLFRNSSKKLKSEEQLQFRHGFLNYMDMTRIACLAQVRFYHWTCKFSLLNVSKKHETISILLCQLLALVCIEVFICGHCDYCIIIMPCVFEQRISRLTERSRGCFKATSSQQLAARIEVVQRQIPGSQYQMQFGPSLRLAFLLLLSIILIGELFFKIARTVNAYAIR
ncbi:hypothetical protein ZIOFF_070678 [Zingiber officinale]|uniref:Uncharacterized protein n=1 Tax=Zingiber officinale TaxID=94328 RepID=A0A8J5C8W5_ZINOF|nr:hypothetical protein ZIOFF_070678 [Zingiber officinale]